MTRLKVNDLNGNPDRSITLAKDRNNTKAIFMKAPIYCKLTPAQAIDLANALADLVEDLSKN